MEIKTQCEQREGCKRCIVQFKNNEENAWPAPQIKLHKTTNENNN
jgi:hypothetical protein